MKNSILCLALFLLGAMALTAEEARNVSQRQIDTRANGERLVEWVYRHIEQYLKSDQQGFCYTIGLGLNGNPAPCIDASILPLTYAEYNHLHQGCPNCQTPADRRDHEAWRRVFFLSALMVAWPGAKSRFERDGYRIATLYLADERDGEAHYKDTRAPDGRILRQDLVCSNDAALDNDRETGAQICVQRARLTLCWDEAAKADGGVKTEITPS